MMIYLYRTILDAQRLDAIEDGLGLENHAFAAAKGTVVYGAMAVVGEVAQVVEGDVY